MWEIWLFINTLRDRLGKEDILHDNHKEQGFKLTSDDVVNLLEFILTTTYFTFRGKIYWQLFGIVMGSPVSLITANIFMETLEQQTIATAPMDCHTKLWLWYWMTSSKWCRETVYRSWQPYKSSQQVGIYPIHIWNWIWRENTIPWHAHREESIDIEYNKSLDHQQTCFEDELNGGSNNIVQSNKSVWRRWWTVLYRALRCSSDHFKSCVSDACFES